MEHTNSHLQRRRRSRGIPAILVVAMAVPLSLTAGVARQAFPTRRSAPLGEAVQFRLDRDLERFLGAIEQEGKKLGHDRFNRSNLIRAAVETYVEPLIELIDREGHLDQQHADQLDEGSEPVAFGNTVRVRLSSNLVEQLDRVEAYARGIGMRHVTRSSLIRAALKALLEGAAEVTKG